MASPLKQSKSKAIKTKQKAKQACRKSLKGGVYRDSLPTIPNLNQLCWQLIISGRSARTL